MYNGEEHSLVTLVPGWFMQTQLLSHFIVHIGYTDERENVGYYIPTFCQRIWQNWLCHTTGKAKKHKIYC